MAPTTDTVSSTGAPCCDDAAVEHDQATCFLRPHFYAGQLLSEEDLKRLNTYIVEKHRFYNRHFHDWGVVCGLMVHCDACNPQQVKVSSGYAIGHNGADIVVPHETAVDVCALLCRDRDPELCPDPTTQDAQEQWLLTVHDDESPRNLGDSHKVDDCCGRGCPDPSVEHNVVCEGFRFELERYTRDSGSRQDSKEPGFLDRVFSCITKLRAAYHAVEASQEQIAALGDLKAQLLEMHKDAITSDCQLIAKLRGIEIPDSSADQNEINATLVDFLGIILTTIQTCLCDAFMPPCPSMQPGGVPIAVITIKGTDCQVVHICNWQKRKLAHTLPNINYWLSGTTAKIKQILARVCCTSLEPLFEDLAPATNAGHTTTARANTANRMTTIEPMLRTAAARMSKNFSKETVSMVDHKIREILMREQPQLTEADLLEPLINIAIQQTKTATPEPSPAQEPTKGSDQPGHAKQTEARLNAQIEQLQSRLTQLEKQVAKNPKRTR